jgi:UDP-N-acetylmuramate dehydrogenase
MTNLGTITGLRGRCWTAKPLAEHVSLRLGGPARWLYQPVDLPDLQHLLTVYPRHEPLYFLGLGSNVLFRDGGFPGLVVLMHGALNGIRHEGEGLFYCEAGVPCARLARHAAQAGFGKAAAFLAGIPGTMGGALAMNAGAFGGETWSFVEAVAVVDRQGQLDVLLPEAFSVGYRRVEGLGDSWFVGAWLRFAPSEPQEAQQAIRHVLRERAVSQPTGLPSCGSVFKNPPDEKAGRLLEAAGLKGYRVGEAQVSTKHANFIITRPGAHAADVENLMMHMQERVDHLFGVYLEPEVRLVGEAA